MDDMLKKIFEIQKEHNDIWQDQDRFNNDLKYRLSVVKDFILGIHQQNTNLLKTFNWSKHTIEQIEDLENSKIEIVDILKYSIGLFILIGGDEKQLYDLFISKSHQLESKWEQMNNKLSSENEVIIFDIDGVIADYSKHYSEFLEQYCGLVKINKSRKSYSFYETYGISRQQEEIFNSDFIKHSGFRTIQPFQECIDVMNEIKKLYPTIKIVLITARPSWIYKRLISDTKYFLSQNNIPYDILLWDKDKADAIINNIMPAKIICMVEDRDKHSIEVAHIGVDVLLMDKTYNSNVQNNDKITRIYKYSEILDFVHRYKLDKWLI